MKVKVIERFVERGVVVRQPGEVLEVSPKTAEELIERGVVKPVESRTKVGPLGKRKEPAEDKAVRPSEDKREQDEGEGS